MELENRVAIITGASEGLGKVILEKFIEEGASVVICARNNQKLIETVRELQKKLKKGQIIISVQADVSKESDVRKVVSSCIDTFGRVDILVNNAGIHGAKGEIDQVDLDEWKRAIDVNLYGTVQMIREVAPYMKEQHSGKIINLAGGGATSARPYFSAYAASKVAIVRLTENFGVEWEKYNIDVNAIAPGAMNTRLLDDILSSKENIGEEYYKAEKQKTEGGVDPHIPAELCVYLASNRSNGISGRLISAVWDNWKELNANSEEIQNRENFKLRRIIPLL